MGFLLNTFYRYDKLVESLAVAGSRQIPCSLVGTTMAVSKFSRGMANRLSLREATSKADDERVPRRCEVYVVSYSPGLIESRLLISRELWRHKIPTDLVCTHQSFPTPSSS